MEYALMETVNLERMCFFKLTITTISCFKAITSSQNTVGLPLDEWTFFVLPREATCEKRLQVEFFVVEWFP